MLSVAEPIRKDSGAMEPDRGSPLLVITPDDRFYCSLLYIATSRGWKTRWARTVSRGLEILRTRPVGVIVLDWFRAEMDWHTAMIQLSVVPDRPRILLAARAIDDDLWSDVLRYRGYDVVRREGDPEQLIRTVRFACQWGRRAWRAGRDTSSAMRKR